MLRLSHCCNTSPESAVSGFLDDMKYNTEWDPFIILKICFVVCCVFIHIIGNESRGMNQDQRSTEYRDKTESQSLGIGYHCEVADVSEQISRSKLKYISRWI